MNADLEAYILQITGAQSCKWVEQIQPLWSNYGTIDRIQLTGSKFESVVVKTIETGKIQAHPRGWSSNVGHNRKVKSYQVERCWYQHWNNTVNANARTPQFYGAERSNTQQWIVLEDLQRNFPIVKTDAVLDDVLLGLRWLAAFHGQFLNYSPNRLWQQGTYWHLQTRQEEWITMQDGPLKQNASKIDQLLYQCQFKTIVHGDAKLANFCFSEDDESIAVVDFQYVGGGCGMKDVAYFIGSCFDHQQSFKYHDLLLDTYFEALNESITIKDFNFLLLETEWRKMYPIACADFVRFLQGWMPTHQKINAYQLEMVELALSQLKK